MTRSHADGACRSFAALRDEGIHVADPCARAQRVEPPDAIVCDLMMPELDGLSFTRWLRVSHAPLPVIIVPGGTGAGERAFAAGRLDGLRVEARRGGLAGHAHPRLTAEVRILRAGSSATLLDVTRKVLWARRRKLGLLAADA